MSCAVVRPLVLVVVVCLLHGCAGDNAATLFGDASQEIISETFLSDVVWAPRIALARKPNKNQCIQLVNQPDNPEFYKFAVNFYVGACRGDAEFKADALAFALRLDPPLDMFNSRAYMLIAEDLVSESPTTAGIAVGKLRVTVQNRKVINASIESLCTRTQEKDFSLVCQLELARDGALNNLSLRATGNAIGLNHAVD